MKRPAAALCLLVLCCHAHAFQAVRPDGARTLLGVRLGAEVASWLEEVEAKLGREVYAEFAELDAADAGGDFTFGVSYLTGAGVAVLRVDESFRRRGARQT